MSKKGRDGGMKTCVCDKCGTTAVAPPGTRHRRCSGQEDKPRSKHNNAPSADRGKWG